MSEPETTPGRPTGIEAIESENAPGHWREFTVSGDAMQKCAAAVRLAPPKQREPRKTRREDDD